MKNLRPTSTLLALLQIAAAIAVAGCSSHSASRENPGQLGMQVSESPRIKMDPDLARSSEALHGYLVGQLAYDREDFKVAIENFSRAGELAYAPVPKIHSALAELLIKQGKFDQSISEIDKALKSSTTTTQPLQLLKAGLLEAQGKFSDALAIYEAVLEKDKSCVDAAYFSAMIMGGHQQASQGIAVLDSFLASNPSNPLVRYLVAVLHEQNGDFERAAGELAQITKDSPDNVSAQFDRVRVLLKAGDRSGAASVADELLQKRAAASILAADVLKSIVAGEGSLPEILRTFELFAPGEIDSRDLRLKLALAHIQGQRYGDALRGLSIIVAQDPQYSLARYYRASIFGGAGRKKEAFADLAEIKPGQELFVRSRTFAAFLMKQDRDFVGAEKAVREALAAEPENKSVFAYLILILRDAKRYKEGLRLINEQLEKDPQSERLLFNKGIILNDLGKMNDAVKVMNQLIENNPAHADALNFVAYAKADEGVDLDEAEALVKRALAVSPDDGFYLDTLGWVYYQRKEYGAAADTLKRAVELSRGDVVVSEHYGDALLKLGKYQEATEVYRTALEKGRDQEPAERSSDVEDALPRLEKKIAEIKVLNPDHSKSIISSRD